MRKIAIVARAGTSALAPFSDDTWEIWGLPWMEMPRATLLFEIHSQACVDQEPLAIYKFSQWLPMCLEKYPDATVLCDPSRTHLFPNGKDYPLEAVMKAVPQPYMENSIAFQLAYALYEHEVLGLKISDIGLFGVHMMGRGEFVWERPSVIYFIGLLQGKGINVFVPPGCPLFLSGWVEGIYGVTGEMRKVTPALPQPGVQEPKRSIQHGEESRESEDGSGRIRPAAGADDVEAGSARRRDPGVAGGEGRPGSAQPAIA